MDLDCTDAFYTQLTLYRNFANSMADKALRNKNLSR